VEGEARLLGVFRAADSRKARTNPAYAYS
jgi:hypothetical protein